MRKAELLQGVLDGSEEQRYYQNVMLGSPLFYSGGKDDW